MIDFLAALSAAGPPPMLGDADDGYVLDLERPGADLDGALCAGAILWGRADWKAQVGRHTESARWLLGRPGRARFEALESAPPAPLLPRAFADTGIYLLQSGYVERGDGVSVLVDCGELGFGSIAAHGHADALSFTLRAFGTDVFVDPGTYDYFTFPEWRHYFRSTRAHNTVEVDGVDQSEMLGAFLWGSHAQARCLLWEPTLRGGRIVAEHDGYLRLPDPVRHRRTMHLDSLARVVSIEDEILARGPHRVTLAFHLAEHCEVAAEGRGRFRIAAGAGTLALVLDARLSAHVRRGGTDPIAGWVSRGYHRRAPATSILATGEVTGTTLLTCRIDIGPAPERVAFTAEAPP
jgi:Heparinase II/III-like protein